MPYSLDELMITAMARRLKGEVMVCSVTAMGALCAYLAKMTHAPELAVLATPESGMEVTPMPTLTLGQFLAENQKGIALTMEDIFDAIFTDRFRIWIHPAQIDRRGNVNISNIGPWDHPKVALVGARGIPEDTSHLSEIFYYLTAHTKRSLVDQVDFRSGAGYGEDRTRHLGDRGRPTALVTDLGVFTWKEDGQFTVESLHPGVDPETVRERTGFTVEIPHEVVRTPGPTAEETEIIRHADPLEMRKLEFMPPHEAASRFVDIYERERQAFYAVWPRREGRAR